MFGRKPVLPVDVDEGVSANSSPADSSEDVIEKAVEVITNNRIKIMESVCWNAMYMQLFTYFVTNNIGEKKCG